MPTISLKMSPQSVSIGCETALDRAASVRKRSIA